MEDIDIYSDVLTEQDETILKLKEKVEVLLHDKKLLTKNFSSVEKAYQQLQVDYQELQQKYKNVTYNASALYKTAQAEIARKNGTIQELRKDYENMVFRKRPNNYTSKQEQSLSPSNLITRVHTDPPILEDKTVPLKELDRSVNSDTETKDNSVKQQEIESTEHNKHNDQYLPNSPNNKPVNISIIPPLQGPITTYSKRLYKKLHGASPENVQIQHSEKHDVCSKNATSKILGVPLRIENNEMISDKSDGLKTKFKPNQITCKLQEEVKEVIKLGSNNINKSSQYTNKNEPELKLNINSSKKEINDKSMMLHNVIIRCDLRENINSLTSSKTTNSVSVHDTIDKILKTHKEDNGVHITSNKSKELPTSEVNRQMATTSDTSTTRNRINNKDSNIYKAKDSTSSNKIETSLTSDNNKLINSLIKSTECANKKIKPIISPATFGKLIPIDIPSLKHKTVKLSANETRELSHNTKTSTIFYPDKDLSKIQIMKSSGNRKNAYLELFGESPIKSEIPNSNLEKLPVEKSRNTTVMSPVQLINSSSPILPSSPSLDSDSPEDLVIDIKASSQNTSRVPVCTEIVEEKCATKTPITTNKGSINLASSSCLQSDRQKEEFVQNVLNYASCVTTKLDKEFPHLSVLSEICSSDIDNQLSIKVQSCGNKRNSVNPKNIRVHGLTSPKETTINKTTEMYVKNVSEETLNLEMNVSETFKTSPRFIPSPPQLTLVSAFKHSENSVFNITEDTVGFVSALTRVRDISPIKTPDKSDTLSNIVEKYSDGNNSTENLIDPPLNNLKSLSLISNVVETTCKSEPEINKVMTNIESGIKKDQNTELNGNCNDRNDKYSKGKNMNGKTNEFKRLRPIRRILTMATTSVEKLTQPNKEVTNQKLSSCNNNICPNVFEGDNRTTNGNHSTAVVTPEKYVGVGNTFLKTTNESGTSNIELSVNSTTFSKSTVNNEMTPEASEKYLLNNAGSSFKLNSSINKLVNPSPPDQKVFKRSESLKMLPKPIPKLNYDTLCKPKEIEEESKQYNKIISSGKEIIPNEELSQIPHIASINKRVRVSKCQSNSAQFHTFINLKNVHSKLSPKQTIQNKTLEKNETTKPFLSCDLRSGEAPTKEILPVDDGQKTSSERDKEQSISTLVMRKSNPNLNIAGKCELTKTQLEMPNDLLESSINIEPEFNSRRQVNNYSNRSPIKGPDPNTRSKCNNDIENKLQDIIRINRHHSSCEQQNESQEPGSFSKSTCISRRDNRGYNKSSSSSPGGRNLNKCRFQPEKSQTSELFSRIRPTFGKRRSESPEINRSSRSKSRSPHRKRSKQRKRTRSISPIIYRRNKSGSRPFHHDHYRTPRDSHHHYYRNSRSKSPYWPRKRFRRSFNSNLFNRSKKYEEETEVENKMCTVTDVKETCQNEQSYKEEVERLREELKLVKSKLNKNYSEDKNYLIYNNIKSVSHSNSLKENSSLKVKTVSPCKDFNKIITSNALSNKFSPINETNRTTRIHENQSNNNCSIQEDKAVFCQHSSQVNETAENKPEPQAAVPLKIIKLRRRKRNLGDSDVNVVSSSSNNNRTQSDSKFKK